MVVQILTKSFWRNRLRNYSKACLRSVQFYLEICLRSLYAVQGMSAAAPKRCILCPQFVVFSQIFCEFYCLNCIQGVYHCWFAVICKYIILQSFAVLSCWIQVPKLKLSFIINDYERSWMRNLCVLQWHIFLIIILSLIGTKNGHCLVLNSDRSCTVITWLEMQKTMKWRSNNNGENDSFHPL